MPEEIYLKIRDALLATFETTEQDDRGCYVNGHWLSMNEILEVIAGVEL